MAIIREPSLLAKTIAEAIGNEPCFLFAGAGIAARAGLKTWFTYIEHLATVAEKYEPLIAQLMRKWLESKLLLEAAHLYKTCPQIPTGERYSKLAEPFIDTQYDAAVLSPLASLPFAGVVTTNYDRSLHDAFGKARQTAPPCVELHDPALREALYWSTFYIARVHGRAEVPKSIVLDVDDYNSLYSNSEYQDFLHHVLTQKTCLFVGFSFLDPAIDRILQYIADRGVQPKKHFALVSPVSDGLLERLAKHNIAVTLYDPKDNHSILWAALAEAATQVRSRKVEPLSTLPGGFDTAKRLLAVCYARAKMEGNDVTALRSLVVQGILLSELANGVTTVQTLAARLRGYYPMSIEEAILQVSVGIDALQQKDLCEREEGKVTLKAQLVPKGGQAAVGPLVNGVVARLIVREKYHLPLNLRDGITNVIEEVIVLRGFDLGAEFSGSETTEELDPSPTINAAMDRHLKGIRPDRRRYIAEAFVDLLRHPDPKEEAVLAELGRLSFGIEVILQAGRTTMYSLSLPEIVYLDASVVLPAIVPGHPYQASYVDAIKRLRDASHRAGSSTAVLIADVFLDEILHHKRKAMELVADRGLDEMDTLQRRVMFYGADKINVFISGYSSWLKGANGEGSFELFLSEQAPYNTKDELKAFLQERGISVVSSHPKSLADTKRLGDATKEVLQAYEVIETAVESWLKKATVLKKHEGCQVAMMNAAIDKKRRVLLITADKMLRRVIAHSRYSYLRESLMTPRNLVQLVDLLVGVEVSPTSLSRLLWSVKLADDRAMIKDYLISRALPHYNAALLLKMNDLLDGYVERILQEARLESIDLTATRLEQRIVTSKFMDRVEDEVFANLAEEMKKLDLRIKTLEQKDR
jgi:hypothetical protein